jgi:hypothetical protein
MNVIDSGSYHLVKMAGKEPANVVSSPMARQAGADKGGGRAEDRIHIGGAAQALATPVVIVNSALAKKREHESRSG